MEEDGDRSRLVLGAIIVGIILVIIIFFAVRGLTSKKSATQTSLPIFTLTPTPSPAKQAVITPTPTPGQKMNGTTKGGLTYPSGVTQSIQLTQPTYWYYQQSQTSGGTTGSQSQSGTSQTQSIGDMTQSQSY